VIRYIGEYSLFFCILAAALWLPGIVLIAATFRNRQLGELRPLASLCLGPGVWMVCTFTLAAVGRLRPAWVFVLLAIWVLLAFVFRSRVLPELRAMRAHGPLAARDLAAGAFLILLLAPCFILAMSPEMAWDANTYHLTVPKLYIAAQGLRPIEFTIQSYWPLNTQLLFAVGMLFKDYILGTMVHFGFGAATLYAIFACCRRFGSRRSAWLAMFLFLANHVVLWELTIAYIDLAYTFLFLAGFVFVLHAIEEPADRRAALLLAGVCSGILVGIKLNGIFGAGILTGCLLWRWLRQPGPDRWVRLRDILAWCVLPAAAISLPWFIRTAWYTGDPVYPLLYGWFGGPDWSPSLSAQFAEWQKSVGMGRGPVDYLLLPFRVILMGDVGYPRFDGRICRWWIVLIPLAVAFGRKNPLARRCLVAAGLYFIAWSVTSQQMRFLIPILPLLAIASAVTLYSLLDRVRDTRRRRVFASLCLIAAWATAAGVNLIHCVVAAGFLSNLHQHGDAVRQMAIHPVYRFINESLPADARLLCLNTNHGFFLDRPYLADSCFEASQIADWLRSAGSLREVRERLDARGITHILIADKDWGIDYPAPLKALLSTPDLARPVYRSDDARFTLLELNRPSVR